MRLSKRKSDELREIKIEIDEKSHAEGAVWVSFGETKVYCTASIENTVPKFLKGSKTGWITAEYGMLPRSTHTRIEREAKQGLKSRTHEIQRLVARSLRTCVDLSTLGEKQIIIDCDVVKADGGTRTASITGGFVALSLACRKMLAEHKIFENPIQHAVVAISVGIVENEIVLDLDYQEDSSAQVDANFVFNELGQLVEIQGTAEKRAFTKEEYLSMLELAQKGAEELIRLQRKVLMPYMGNK